MSDLTPDVIIRGYLGSSDKGVSFALGVLAAVACEDTLSMADRGRIMTAIMHDLERVS